MNAISATWRWATDNGPTAATFVWRLMVIGGIGYLTLKALSEPLAPSEPASATAEQRTPAPDGAPATSSERLTGDRTATASNGTGSQLPTELGPQRSAVPPVAPRPKEKESTTPSGNGLPLAQLIAADASATSEPALLPSGQVAAGSEESPSGADSSAKATSDSPPPDEASPHQASDQNPILITPEFTESLNDTRKLLQSIEDARTTMDDANMANLSARLAWVSLFASDAAGANELRRLDAVGKGLAIERDREREISASLSRDLGATQKELKAAQDKLANLEETEEDRERTKQESESQKQYLATVPNQVADRVLRTLAFGTPSEPAADEVVLLLSNSEAVSLESYQGGVETYLAHPARRRGKVRWREIGGVPPTDESTIAPGAAVGVVTFQHAGLAADSLFAETSAATNGALAPRPNVRNATDSSPVRPTRQIVLVLPAEASAQTVSPEIPESWEGVRIDVLLLANVEPTRALEKWAPVCWRSGGSVHSVQADHRVEKKTATGDSIDVLTDATQDEIARLLFAIAR